MNDNYAVINGKKIELTEKQIKALGFEVRKNPFLKVAVDHMYYFISHFGDIDRYRQAKDLEDDMLFNNINYFNDEYFANQVALHQLLYRKLLKYAYDNEFEDEEWNGQHDHWYIYYNFVDNKFDTAPNDAFKHQEVYFSSADGAKRAIEEVVEPFMKEHPDFVW